MLVKEFNNRIEGLESAILKKEFDISGYLLPDKEVVKNIIRLKNPEMSKQDIELMVHGYNYVPPVDIPTQTISKTITKSNYSFNVKNLLIKWEAEIVYSSNVIGKRDYNINYSFTSDGKNYFGEEAIRKSLEKESNDSGFTFNNISYPKTEKVEISSTINNTIISPPDSKDKKSNIIANDDYDPYPLSEGHSFYKEAQTIKEDVKRSAALVMAHKKELLNNIISSSTLLASSIPGMALMISAPPWNVPGAMSLGATVLSVLNDLIAKSVKVINNIQPLKKMYLVMSEKKFDAIVRILNPIISVLIAILNPIEKIRNFISKLINRLKGLVSAKSCRKQLRQIRREIRRKTIAKILERKKEEKKEIQEEIDDLKERLKSVMNDCGKKTNIEQDIDKLNSLVDEINSESDRWIETLRFETVYDVQLPNGDILIGLSEEELTNLKKDYTIIFNS